MPGFTPLFPPTALKMHIDQREVKTQPYLSVVLKSFSQHEIFSLLAGSPICLKFRDILVAYWAAQLQYVRRTKSNKHVRQHGGSGLHFHTSAYLVWQNLEQSINWALEHQLSLQCNKDNSPAKWQRWQTFTSFTTVSQNTPLNPQSLL